MTPSLNMESEIFLSVYNNYATVQLYKPRLLQYYYLKYDYPNIRKPSGRQRFSSFSMLKAKIFLIENSLSMSKGFLDHNLFHDPNVTTIHRDYPDDRAKDVRNCQNPTLTQLDSTQLNSTQLKATLIN